VRGRQHRVRANHRAAAYRTISCRQSAKVSSVTPRDVSLGVMKVVTSFACVIVSSVDIDTENYVPDPAVPSD
jgi:hypothetical protein